jgi:hypothetical protein
MKFLLTLCFCLSFLFSNSQAVITYGTKYKQIEQISQDSFLLSFFKSNCIDIENYKIINLGQLSDTLKFQQENGFNYNYQILKVTKKPNSDNFNYEVTKFNLNPNLTKFFKEKLLYGYWYTRDEKFFYQFFIIN